MPTPCPPLLWSDAASTGYWSSGPGCWVEPDDVESGTLNWTTWMLPVQWPAVRKHPAQSSMSQAVQPTGIRRPARGSVEGWRSSTLPDRPLFIDGRQPELDRLDLDAARAGVLVRPDLDLHRVTVEVGGGASPALDLDGVHDLEPAILHGVDAKLGAVPGERVAGEDDIPERHPEPIHTGLRHGEAGGELRPLAPDAVGFTHPVSAWKGATSEGGVATCDSAPGANRPERRRLATDARDVRRLDRCMGAC